MWILYEIYIVDDVYCILWTLFEDNLIIQTTVYWIRKQQKVLINVMPSKDWPSTWNTVGL